jgi:hypothetical protein
VGKKKTNREISLQQRNGNKERNSVLNYQTKKKKEEKKNKEISPDDLGNWSNKLTQIWMHAPRISRRIYSRRHSNCFHCQTCAWVSQCCDDHVYEFWALENREGKKIIVGQK